MSASEDATDAVAEARVTDIRKRCDVARAKGIGGPVIDDIGYLVARIDDLEAKLAAVTREWDAAICAFEVVRALHSPLIRINAVDWCPACKWQYYPCATLRALDGVEAVQALLKDVAVTQAGDSATIAAHEEPLAGVSIAPPDDGQQGGTNLL